MSLYLVLVCLVIPSVGRVCANFFSSNRASRSVRIRAEIKASTTRTDIWWQNSKSPHRLHDMPLSCFPSLDEGFVRLYPHVAHYYKRLTRHSLHLHRIDPPWRYCHAKSLWVFGWHNWHCLRGPRICTFNRTSTKHEVCRHNIWPSPSRDEDEG